MNDGERYTVISADCHGGGDIGDYRPYLESRLHDEFDRWRAEFANPYGDLEDGGVVAEVIFPNPVPPFFPTPSLLHQPPAATAGDLDLRWAGLHAHNRWLAEFCAAAPGRRARIAQILLHDVDRAVEEGGWAKE